MNQQLHYNRHHSCFDWVIVDLDQIITQQLYGSRLFIMSLNFSIICKVPGGLGFSCEGPSDDPCPYPNGALLEPAGTPDLFLLIPLARPLIRPRRALLTVTGFSKRTYFYERTIRVEQVRQCGTLCHILICAKVFGRCEADDTSHAAPSNLTSESF